MEAKRSEHILRGCGPRRLEAKAGGRRNEYPGGGDQRGGRKRRTEATLRGRRRWLRARLLESQLLHRWANQSSKLSVLAGHACLPECIACRRSDLGTGGAGARRRGCGPKRWAAGALHLAAVS